MNYFDHHIGDYDQATAHLTACEDGIYSRLIRWYMADERPLPADLKTIQRRVRAHSKDEKQAVVDVLAEFFELQDDGYHQVRCDRELARYHDTAPDKNERRENDRERQRRARDRRKGLFEDLRCHGIVPAFDAKTSELEALLSRVLNTVESRDVTPTVTAPVTPVTRDNTATQYPVPSNQKPREREGTRGTRLPTDWEPGETGFAFAAQHGMANGRAHSELEKFKDWWAAQPGQKGVKLDWQATWRTWVRKAAEFSAAGGRPQTDDIFAGSR